MRGKLGDHPFKIWLKQLAKISFQPNHVQIAAENVGQRNFTWRIEYFGNEEKNVEMAPGDHANHECLCVPMDMYVDYEVSFVLS